MGPGSVASACVKEIVAVTRADEVDTLVGDRERPGEVSGMAPVKNDKRVVAGAAGADLVGEIGDQDHLAQAGGVALGHHRRVGGEVLEQR